MLLELSTLGFAILLLCAMCYPYVNKSANILQDVSRFKY